MHTLTSEGRGVVCLGSNWDTSSGPGSNEKDISRNDVSISKTLQFAFRENKALGWARPGLHRVLQL